jgi:hypothetical protein
VLSDGQLAWVPSSAKLWMTNPAGSTYRYTYVSTPKYVVVTEADCADAWSCSKVFFDGEHWLINNKDVFPTETKEG